MRKQFRFFFTLLAISSFSGFGQEITTALEGRVRSLRNDVSNILIVNLNSKESTITDSLGQFTIEVRLKDTLQITAVQYVTSKITITDAIFAKNSVVITLLENVINLKEVTVTPYNLTGKIDLDIERLGLEPTVTSSSLGLPNADIEVMSQSERLLLEADRGKYVRLGTMDDHGKLIQILGYATISVIINSHKIMNRASGRTKSLEERVARDEQMTMEKEIITKFSKQTIVETFDIPLTHVDGFLTYCMSQTDFLAVAQQENSIEIWEYLKARSIEFKETNSSKEK
ncbi:hypothetical protein [Maribacter sp. 2307UL18-2]|uniref:hypothetical protein n=1 Tax=Maribacter sp. 2307UL18-2 TaxID=3386274 RepID=UPI0039BC83A3